MTNELQVFSYNGANIRAIDIDGVPYFVGKDVATVLGYRRAADAITAHVDDEDRLSRRFTDSGQRGLSRKLCMRFSYATFGKRFAYLT